MLEELTWAFLSLAVAQPHTGAAAVFVDELDAGTSNWVRFLCRRRTGRSAEIRALLALLRLLMVPQPYAGAAAVLVDELATGARTQLGSFRAA